MRFFKKKGQKRAKKKKMLKKSKKGKNMWKFGQKCTKFEHILKKGRWLCEIIALNKLLEKVVGTLKRLTAHASLDTPFSEEIPTPKQLFASKNLLIQQKEIVLSIEHIIPGSYMPVLMMLSGTLVLQTTFH